MQYPSAIQITGKAPFDKSGVYEAHVTICQVNPTKESVRKNEIPSLWDNQFHLKVDDGTFTITLGDKDRPLPESVFANSPVWVVIKDIFSSNYSVVKVVTDRYVKHNTQPKPDTTRLPIPPNEPPRPSPPDTGISSREAASAKAVGS
ncbi:MAG: hypothetical protein F4245_01405, partial [Cenarchaeum sp. SB0678_bin_8]|nr:hypothetical protein [Cenarchaeum sp. SB0678_bin_8]